MKLSNLAYLTVAAGALIMPNNLSDASPQKTAVETSKNEWQIQESSSRTGQNLDKIVSNLGTVYADASTIKRSDEPEHSISSPLDSAIFKPDMQKRTDYDTILHNIKSTQKSFQRKYAAADHVHRAQIIQEAREYVIGQITNNIMPAWYGTKWDFNGSTTKPGEGKIACGIYVATTLKQAGFNFHRTRHGTQPFEHLIKNFTSDIDRYSNKPVSKVLEDVKKKGPGLYIAGLDCHGGFLVNKGAGDIRFVHSSYYWPNIGVMGERLGTDNPFKASKYRVVGKILGDKMMKCWLTGNKIPLIHNYYRKNTAEK
ncbi:hypothetical protein K9M79_05760 [Candidatus Woesearchaeota archaeon]|nr:hypothetical protein [Candidatus Woesearchaeota archaeon]